MRLFFHNCIAVKYRVIPVCIDKTTLSVLSPCLKKNDGFTQKKRFKGNQISFIHYLLPSIMLKFLLAYMCVIGFNVFYT